jgi:hypothetical protein
MLGASNCGGDTSEKEEPVSTELTESLRTKIGEARGRSAGRSSAGGSTSATLGITDGAGPSESASDEGPAIQSSPSEESEIVIGAGEGNVIEIGRCVAGVDTTGERGRETRLARGVVAGSSSSIVGTVEGDRSDASYSCSDGVRADGECIVGVVTVKVLLVGSRTVEARAERKPSDCE